MVTYQIYTYKYQGLLRWKSPIPQIQWVCSLLRYSSLNYELNRLLLGYFLGFTFGLNIVFSFLRFFSHEEMEMDIQDVQTENQPKAAVSSQSVSTTSSWRKHVTDDNATFLAKLKDHFPYSSIIASKTPWQGYFLLCLLRNSLAWIWLAPTCPSRISFFFFWSSHISLKHHDSVKNITNFVILHKLLGSWLLSGAHSMTIHKVA